MSLGEIWIYIEGFSVIVGLLTFAIAVYGWIKLRVFERDYKQKIIRITNEHARNTNGVLILSLSPEGSIETQVKNFIKNDANLKDIINDDLIYPVTRAKLIKPEDLDGIIEEIKMVRKKMLEAGVNKIHFFAFGACIGPAIVGSIFSNGCPVIYYKNVQDTYENWGPIERY